MRLKPDRIFLVGDPAKWSCIDCREPMSWRGPPTHRHMFMVPDALYDSAVVERANVCLDCFEARLAPRVLTMADLGAWDLDGHNKELRRRIAERVAADEER